MRKLRPTVTSRDVQGSLAVVILRIHISAMRQKQFSDLRVALVGCQKQRRLAILVPGIDFGVISQQQFRCVLLSHSNRVV